MTIGTNQNRDRHVGRAAEPPVSQVAGVYLAPAPNMSPGLAVVREKTSNAACLIVFGS